MFEISFEQLSGRDEGHLNFAAAEAPLHHAVVAPWQALKADAETAGFDLTIASSFRNFERQCLIWNGKAQGVRPVFDADGQRLEIKDLNDWQLAQSILRWSALPGASRHHWGTDIDVYDRLAVSADYQLQLSVAEVSEGGPFDALHCWLDEKIAAGDAYGFFRSYQYDRGGVAPERWHLSYAPLAKLYQQQLVLEQLLPLWSGLALSEVLQQHAEYIYQTYVMIPWSDYPE